MKFEQALEEDILAVLPFDGGFLSTDQLTRRVAPLRRKEVLSALYSLWKRGFLELNRGGGGIPWYYGRRALRRI